MFLDMRRLSQKGFLKFCYNEKAKKQKNNNKLKINLPYSLSSLIQNLLYIFET